MAPDRVAFRLCLLQTLAITAACGRTSLADLPLWRVELDPSGREVRLVSLPFKQVAYDMKTNLIVREVMDRNQDGVSDRIISYEGFGGARTEETDTNFDGTVDRWDTFGPEGQRLRSATASNGSRPDRVATYDRAGRLSRVEIDADLDGRFELTRIYVAGKLDENRIDSDGNGRVDRVQKFEGAFMSAEDFDTDEDGAANLRMTFSKEGTLLRVSILQAATGGAGRR